MDLKLDKEIVIESLNIRAVISFPEKIGYFLPILHHVIEMGGKTNAKSFSKKLLGSENIEIAKSLLSQCEYLGLLEKEQNDYKITKEGNIAIQEEIFFVPQEGTWNIMFANDNMIPNDLQVVKIEPVKVDYFSNQKLSMSEKSKNKRVILPKFVSSLHNTRVKCIIGSDFIIKKFEKKAEITKQTKGHISWKPRKELLVFSINDNKDSITIPFSPITHDQIWEELLKSKNIRGDWNKNNGKIFVSFNQTTTQERIDMQRVLVFEKPKILQYGAFKDLRLTVNIWSKTKYDAQQWAEFLFYKSITEYATKGNYEKWRKNIQTKFADYKIQIKKRSDLIPDEYNKKHTAKFWYLSAMEDWNL